MTMTKAVDDSIAMARPWPWRGKNEKKKMQLDVEVSPPAFVWAQLEQECTCSAPGVYMQCRLNVGCIGFAVYLTLTLEL